MLDSSEDEDEESESGSDGAKVADNTPSKVVKTTQQFLGVQGRVQGHKKSASTASASSMTRSRDGGMESASDEENERVGKGAREEEGIGVTSPTSTGNGDAELTGSESNGKPGKQRGENNGKAGTVSLGHLCTNVIILQEFALEVAAIVEVRGALFEEVRYL